MIAIFDIVQIRRRNIISEWKRVTVKRQAAKMIGFHCQNAVKAIVIRNMINRFKFQNSVIYYMQSQRQYYINLTAFNRLKLAAFKRKSINEANNIIENRKDYWLAKKSFSKWFRKYNALKKVYTTYAFCAVQIKNSISKECFECFKIYTKNEKNKRIAVQFYERNQKQKLMNTLYNKQLASNHDYNASSLIIQRQKYKIKSSVMNSWRLLYQSVSAQRNKLENFIQTKQNLKLVQIIAEWRSLTKINQRIRLCQMNLQKAVDKKRKSIGMSMFTNGISVLKERKRNQEKADRYYSAITLRKIKNAWCQRAFENRAETSKVAKIRNMIKRKNVLKCWDVMLNASHEKRMKIRYIRSVTKIPQTIEYRIAFARWKKFVAKEQKLDEKVDQGWKYFKQKRQAIALNRLIEHYIELKQIREEIQEYKAKQFEKVISFRANKLSSKAMIAWKKYMTENYELFIKRKALVKKLRERNLPCALNKWINYAKLKSSYNEKRGKAYKFLASNLINKSMKALEINNVERKEFRVLYKQACLYHCENLVYKGFSTLKNYSINSIETRHKREIMFNKISSLDKTLRLKKAISSFAKFNCDTADTLSYFKDILMKKKKQRLFNYLRYFKNKKLDLRVRYEALKDATEKRIKHCFILKWVKEYDNQWVIKELRAKQELKIKFKWFTEFKREHQFNVICKQHITEKTKEITIACFNAFKSNTKYNKFKKSRMEIAKNWHLKNIKRRVFGGFSFNILIVKSLELVNKKRLLNYKARVFGSLKWNWEMKNMQKDFHKIVEARILKEHFYGWYEAAYDSTNKVSFLQHILNKRHHYNQIEAFKIWKRDTFFKTMVTIIDQLVIQPDNKQLIANVFYSWKRAQDFEKAREYCESLADENHKYNLTCKMFTAWKVAAEPDMKKYLKMKRAFNTITNIMVTRPFYQLISISEKEKVKEDKAYYFYKHKQTEFLDRIFIKWRKVLSEQKFEHIKIKHIHSHFKALESNTVETGLNGTESQLTFVDNNSNFMVPNFKLPVKLQIQTTCIKLFQGWTETTNVALLQKYLNALKYNCRLQKIRREQHEYSGVYYCQNLKRKYIRKIVEGYNNALDLKENEQTAVKYYSEKSLAFYWNAFVEGVQNSRLEKILEVSYNKKLKTKVFMSLAENIKINNKKKKLNNTMIQFMKDKNKYIIKHTYLTWRNHFELERYYNKAVSEFSEYRNSKLAQNILKAMAIRVKKEKHLRELEKRATDYFSKRAELKLMRSAFTSLHKHSLKEKFSKSGKAEEIASNHYLIVQGGKILNVWKLYTLEQKNKEVLSRKLAIFSAWKFYAKQNSLVKKYLKECDFSSSNTGDGSLKCTIKSPQQEISKRLSRDTPPNNLFSVECKENKGYMSMNHPNVTSNQFNKFS